jgi:hypothetical protein
MSLGPSGNNPPPHLPEHPAFSPVQRLFVIEQHQRRKLAFVQPGTGAVG